MVQINRKNVKENLLSHAMVHYLLTIHRLKEEKGYARVTDIAKNLGLTKGSVSTAINTLKKRKLVIEEDGSKFLILSTEGHQEVHEILSSRTLLYYFLRDILGVRSELAHQDSCYMEHLLHKETRDHFFEFMKRYSTTKESQKGNGQFIFHTTLDLTTFASPQEFEASQKADSFPLEKE